MERQLRVLIIEDSEDDVVLISRQLKKSKFEIETTRVETKQELECALASSEWDVILSDFTLPAFNAFGALEVARRMAPDVPFIIVSGSIGEDTAVNAMRAGAHDYLMKDSLARLVPAIERELQDCAMRRERRQAAIDLQESEARLRAIVETAVDAIITIDSNGLIDSVNPATEHMFGYTEREMVGHNISMLMPPRLSGPSQRFDEIVESNLTGSAGSSGETRGLKRDSTTFSIDVSVSEVKLGDRQIYTVMIRDISDRRRLEEQLLQSQRMDSIGRLAGGIAHDFNNILTIVFGYSEILEKSLSQASSEASCVANIQKAAKRASSLTHQLLAFARRQIIEPKIVLINDLIANIEKMLYRLIGENIELKFIPGHDIGVVKVDPGQFEQIVVNLTVNARDAMPDGGRITIETSDASLDGDYARQYVGVSPGEYVAMSISDTGSGMPPDVISHLFEPFYTTKPQGKGTGLGLATCYGIVKQAGGHIWVYSEEGIGTTFKVYLPRVVEIAPAVSAPEESRQPQGGSETVLLVEDEQMVRDITAQILVSRGYNVLLAANADEALKLSRSSENTIDIMVTDVIMPGLSGKQLAEILDRERPDMKVLYVSGYTDEAIVHHGVLDAGIVFLQKPFSSSTLLNKIREVLEVSQNSGTGAK